MIVRLIFIAIVFVALTYLYRRLRRPSSPQIDTCNDYTDTVSCAHCGLTLPKNDAIQHNDKHYCCKAHSKQS